MLGTLGLQTTTVVAIASSVTHSRQFTEFEHTTWLGRGLGSHGPGETGHRLCVSVSSVRLVSTYSMRLRMGVVREHGDRKSVV